MAVFLFTIINPVGQLMKARDAQRKSDLAQIQRALETYYNDFGYYPPQCTATDFRIKRLDGNCVVWGSTLSTTNFSPYINSVPNDPLSSQNYVYYSSPTTGAQSYYLYTSLERGAQDPQACNQGAQCTNVPVGVYCGSSSSYICNYGATSSNVTP